MIWALSPAPFGGVVRGAEARTRALAFSIGRTNAAYEAAMLALVGAP